MRNNGLFKFLMIFCFLGTVLMSCDKDDDDEKIDLDEVHKFEIKFVGKWSKEVYGKDLPKDAKFESFIGLTHNKPNKLYRLGNLASESLAEYCESGVSTELEKDINSMIADKSSSVLIQAGSIQPDGEVVVNFETSLRHRYLTCVGRISPSSDWFVSIENVDLMNGTTVLFQVNDAGVKGGESFTGPWEDTQEAISRVTSGELTVNGVVPTMGYAMIRRVYPEDDK